MTVALEIANELTRADDEIADLRMVSIKGDSETTSLKEKIKALENENIKLEKRLQDELNDIRRNNNNINNRRMRHQPQSNNYIPDSDDDDLDSDEDRSVGATTFSRQMNNNNNNNGMYGSPMSNNKR